MVVTDVIQPVESFKRRPDHPLLGASAVRGYRQALDLGDPVLMVGNWVHQ